MAYPNKPSIFRKHYEKQEQKCLTERTMGLEWRYCAIQLTVPFDASSCLSVCSSARAVAAYRSPLSFAIIDVGICNFV